ncbi:hypothetical protein ACGFYE_31305 [Streptomyces zaomyceticus]|uniref:hypothetical protein n=1 Tax=Streptomyces zaomyceticus TaxID=68286 RepID=UPI00371CE071
MTALDLPGASLGGVLSRYSTAHMPEAEPAACFAELRRAQPNCGGSSHPAVMS